MVPSVTAYAAVPVGAMRSVPSWPPCGRGAPQVLPREREGDPAVSREHPEVRAGRVGRRLAARRLARRSRTVEDRRTRVRGAPRTVNDRRAPRIPLIIVYRSGLRGALALG